MDQKPSDDKGVSRREFIKGAVAGSAVLATTGIPQDSQAQQPQENASPARPYARLRSLPPGSIQPEGWLRLHMEAQAELTSALPEISYPFSKGFWEGEENSPAWFAWEQRAYWVDGATRLALVLQNDALLAKARIPLDYTLAHPSSTGYLGPKYLEHSEGGFGGGLNRWPNTVFNRAFMALADAQPAPHNVDRGRIADALRTFYLHDKASLTGGARNITNLEIILWCYEHTGDRRLLEMAEEAWNKFENDAENQYKAAAKEPASAQGARMRAFRYARYADLAPSRVFAGTPVQAHGVSYAEISKQPAILYLYTGNEHYRQFAVAAQQRIFQHHMLIDGIPSSQEGLAGTTALNEHETCDITDHPWSWIYMLQATGDGVWGDHVERACFNAHPGATKNDWKGIQYFGSPNQFLANLNCDHDTARWFGSRRMAYAPNPAQVIGCCGGNKHRCIPNYAISMWMKTADHGLAATLYGPSTVSTTVGSELSQVHITQKTNYPFEEEIRFHIQADRPVSFPLLLRIPAWCHTPQIKVNGRTVPILKRNAFAIVRRTFRPGDTVTLHLPMSVKITEWPHSGVGVERGPLVYALPIQAKWSSIAEAAYSSEQFPTWQADPAGRWNYGVVPDPKQIAIQKMPSTQSIETSSWPWSHAPIALTVPARKLEGWDYQVNPKPPHQRFTPQLPDPAGIHADSGIERLTLLPFGATNLRMSIFPKLKS